ncbi:ABC transporter permease [Crenobacter sp. SG2303]|uniref:ABC transporter permease n=1 Tax=Crenobacter oryzisoli TaxID=3056844 RepID=A0ABT7XQL7_9NEIS|nr:ABC transporter permease [Crenobacter sp. SG2303]MDN0076067.1 ABC transporter permease [Crenobacter sp. SG2303]
MIRLLLTPTRLGRLLPLWLLLAPALIWLVGLILLPHLDLLWLSLQTRGDGGGDYTFGAGNYLTFFDEPLYWRTFARTAVMSLIATALTLVTAFPIAWYLAKIAQGRLRQLLFVLCLLPFWVSEMVRTFGWILLLQSNGVIPHLLQRFGFTDQPVELLYHDATILLGLVYSSLLFMVIPLANTLDTLDDSLVEAAYNLGGNGVSILRDIVLPHAAPGIAAGTIVVFMLTLGNYLSPVLLGGKNSLWFTEQIYNQFITRFNWQQGAAFGFLLLILSTLLVWAGLKLTGQSFGEAMRKS